MLDEHWNRNKSLQQYPIYQASGAAGRGACAAAGRKGAAPGCARAELRHWRARRRPGGCKWPLTTACLLAL
jgi:hypothetical protein